MEVCNSDEKITNSVVQAGEAVGGTCVNFILK